jgi:hypothetical protein
MDELFGCPIATGTIDAILSRTGDTLEPVYHALLEQTRTAAALNIDETGCSGAPSASARPCCGSLPSAASSTCTRPHRKGARRPDPHARLSN